MQRFVLRSLKILLLVSLLGCGNTDWNWIPDPYTVDYEAKVWYNADDEECGLSDECINDLIAFPWDNIEELKVNIEKLDIPKKYKKRVMKEFNLFLRKVGGIR